MTGLDRPHPPGDPGPAQRGDATVSKLAEPFSIGLPAISRHLKVLEASAWMERYREFWDSSFDRLDAHLQRIQQEPTDNQKHGERAAP